MYEYAGRRVQASVECIFRSDAFKQEIPAGTKPPRIYIP